MRRAALVLGSTSLLVSVTAGVAWGVNQPGDPCPTNGATEQLGGGWITCTNGTWQPSQGPSGAAPAPGSTPASSGTTTITSLKGVSPIGTALTPSTFGSTKGQVADASAIRLPDGRVRVYVYVADEGVRSATSTNASGTTFVAEPTKPIPWTMAGQPRAVSLGGNSVRLFYLSGGNINSALSSDGGLTFTDEGPVITTAQAGFEPGALTIVKKGGAYRGYFSNLERPGERGARIIRTATSGDMLHWTMGPVISQGAGALKDGGSHPFAVVDKKGRVALYYSADRGSYYGVLVSTSTDGLTFAKERSVLAGAGDPDVLAVGKRGGLMYYGFDLGGGAGFGIKVAKLSSALVP